MMDESYSIYTHTHTHTHTRWGKGDKSDWITVQGNELLTVGSI